MAETGEFSHEGADIAREAAGEMFDALSKPKQREYLGNYNEVLVFIENARATMPAPKKKAKQGKADPGF